MRRFLVGVLLSFSCLPIASAADGLLRGEVRDAKSNELLAARVYVKSAEGKWFHMQVPDKAGTAVPYSKQRDERSAEHHTAVSAHPFEAKLPAGKYVLTVERGKEFLPFEQPFEIKDEPVEITVKLKRWFDMAKLGWYSGETHVHRKLEELPTAMLADDLNVTLPLTYWVTKADTPPTQGDKNLPAGKTELIAVDETHVIYPLNTEYELFTVGGKQHTLGAIFALNQKKVLELGAPPVRPIAEQVHAEGGLLELDKHNWPWSMMLVPVMNVDLYELANNHHWRSEFHFRKFGDPPPDFMNVETDADGLTEKGWIDYTFQNYYTLLNCGFRLRPTAGTASGVHPVPLGFGRVYVNLPDGFSYEKWLAGLNAGHSFVTTGPLLLIQINDREPGDTFAQPATKQKYRIFGWARSTRPLSTIEVVSAGSVVKTIRPLNTPRPGGGFESQLDIDLEIFKSTWLAVRCYEPTADGRLRFAHTAPAHIDVERRPLRPRAEEVQFLVRRMESEITRNTGVLSAAAMQEFRDALAKYKELETQVVPKR